MKPLCIAVKTVNGVGEAICQREMGHDGPHLSGDLAWESDGAVTGALRSQPSVVNWQEAAIRLGEELASVGPTGYYAFSATEWLAWALAAVGQRQADPARILKAEGSQASGSAPDPSSSSSPSLRLLERLHDEIAAHCASFFWNDVDIGLLHAKWRDDLTGVLRLQHEENEDDLARIGQLDVPPAPQHAPTDRKG